MVKEVDQSRLPPKDPFGHPTQGSAFTCAVGVDASAFTGVLTISGFDFARDNFDFSSIAGDLALAKAFGNTLNVDLDNDAVIDMQIVIDGLNGYGGSLTGLLV